MNPSTDFGICRSRSSWVQTFCSGLLRSTDLVTLSGTIANTFVSTRKAISGACATRANTFSISPTRRGLGSVRWKQRPSSFGWCARCTMAFTT